MSQQVHVLRLGPARQRGSFRDYSSGLYLTFPEKVEGTVPPGANLSNLIMAIKTRALEDVNGTVIAAWEASKAPKKGEDPTPVPAVEQPEVAPAEAVEAPAEAVENKTEESAPKKRKK